MGGKKSAPAPAPAAVTTPVTPKGEDTTIQRTAADQDRLEGNASPTLLSGAAGTEDEEMKKKQAGLLTG